MRGNSKHISHFILFFSLEHNHSWSPGTDITTSLFNLLAWNQPTLLDIITVDRIFVLRETPVHVNRFMTDPTKLTILNGLLRVLQRSACRALLGSFCATRAAGVIAVRSVQSRLGDDLILCVFISPTQYEFVPSPRDWEWNTRVLHNP